MYYILRKITQYNRGLILLDLFLDNKDPMRHSFLVHTYYYSGKNTFILPVNQVLFGFIFSLLWVYLFDYVTDIIINSSTGNTHTMRSLYLCLFNYQDLVLST